MKDCLQWDRADGTWLRLYNFCFFVFLFFFFRFFNGTLSTFSRFPPLLSARASKKKKRKGFLKFTGVSPPPGDCRLRAPRCTKEDKLGGAFTSQNMLLQDVLELYGIEDIAG
jgi:hypothetical protein